MNWLSKLLRSKPKNKAVLHKYTSQLYIECTNLLIQEGYEQVGNYVFQQQKSFGKIFCVYHFYTDGLCVNVYYPQEKSKTISSVNEMRELINSYNK